MELPTHGQGVILFRGGNSFSIWNRQKTEYLSVEFTDTEVLVTKNDKVWPMKSSGGLTRDPAGYMWFSIDSQNVRLRAGIGEARMETMHSEGVSSCAETDKKWLESLCFVVGEIEILHILRDPIVYATPMLVADMRDLSLDMVAEGKYVPNSTLPAAAQQLYACVAGPKFTLDDPSFPEFSAAIQRSILTPGLWCFETLKRKAGEFGKPNPDETYLRITLGQNSGESPGVPYVMEIWPAGHFSPVHSHSEANAVIRVLHGGIHVSLYPFLSAAVKPCAQADFKEGEITWLNAYMNQTHQLKNITNDVCVTIQCYMYDASDKRHYDYFDYLDADGKIQQYEPDSDMGYVDFKKMMKKEWSEFQLKGKSSCVLC